MTRWELYQERWPECDDCDEAEMMPSKDGEFVKYQDVLKLIKDYEESLKSNGDYSHAVVCQTIRRKLDQESDSKEGN